MAKKKNTIISCDQRFCAEKNASADKSFDKLRHVNMENLV